jgi:uncharacterized protein
MDPARKDFLGRGWSFPVRIDASTGNVASAEFEQDVREAILIILETSPGERVMRPGFGCGIHDLVFESPDMAMVTRIESTVREALTRFEPRIEIQRIFVDVSNALNGALVINLDYRLRNTNQTGNLVYPFYFRESGTVETRGSRA